MTTRFPQFGNVFGNGSASGRNEIVSFNAGKMVATPTSNGKFMITPDLKKGKICLSRGDDQLLHFQWIDRLTGASPDDFIIFPDDASFIKVDTGRPGDRVYLLQYKNSSRRFFFWMQNKDASKDEDLAKKVNDGMNNIQSPSSTGVNDGPLSSRGGPQLDHNAIMQMLGAMGVSEQARGAGGSGGRGGPNAVQMSDLTGILQSMGLPAVQSSAVSSPATSAVSSSQASQNGGGSSAAATTASTHDHDVSGMDMEDNEDELLRLAIEESMRDQDQEGTVETQNLQSTSSAAPSQQQNITTTATQPSQQTSFIPVQTSQSGITTEQLQQAMAAIQGLNHTPISMASILESGNIAPLLQDQAIAQRLLNHLPEGAQTLQELHETLRSPPFRHSISSLSQALHAGHFETVMTNFGLDPRAGRQQMAFGDVVGGFLAAIQQWADHKESEN